MEEEVRFFTILVFLIRCCPFQMVFDYLDAGADDEISLRRGKDAYTELEMHYKILAGIKPPLDLSTKIFGQDVKLPFFGCPTAGNRMFHWEGGEYTELLSGRSRLLQEFPFQSMQKQKLHEKYRSHLVS